ncbi:MAG: hypothetical protein P8X82_06310 [Gemmatimonadales bacterium]
MAPSSVRADQEGGELTGAGPEDQPTKLGFNELLLGAVIVLMLACAALITALYVLPSEHLDVPELLPGVRVARQADFPVGDRPIFRSAPAALSVGEIRSFW